MTAAARPHWEERLLGSPAAPLYRAAVGAVARGMLAYFAHAPAGFPRHAVWQRIGYRYVFSRGYTRIARTSFGAAIACSMKDLIQRHIMFFGIWEPNLTAFVQRRLAGGDVFIDLGANVGYFSLLASRLVGPSGSVVAVEAAPDIFRALRDNLARNRADNVRAVEIAVAAAPGRVRLYSDGGRNLGATTMLPTPGYAALTDVAAAPFEQIVTADEVRRARMIKIDLEGAELPPLRAVLALSPGLRADAEIVVELSPESLRQAGGHADEIVGAFRDAGYHAYDLQNSYSIAGYFARQPATPPRRIRGPVTEQTDVVFSRLDAEEL